MILDRLSISTPIDDPTILYLSAAYCITIVRNHLRLLEGRLFCYEHISTVTKHICRIVVPVSLRNAIFNLIHASPIAGHMGVSLKHYTAVKFVYFDLDCSRMFLIG